MVPWLSKGAAICVASPGAQVQPTVAAVLCSRLGFGNSSSLHFPAASAGSGIFRVKNQKYAVWRLVDCCAHGMKGVAEKDFVSEFSK